jgi:hypothetical protein
LYEDVKKSIKAGVFDGYPIISISPKTYGVFVIETNCKEFSAICSFEMANLPN